MTAQCLLLLSTTLALFTVATKADLVASNLDVNRISKLLSALLDYEDQLSKRNEEYTEAAAVEWLVKYNEEYYQYLHAYAEAEYTFTTNITDYNMQQYNDAENRLGLWQVDQVKEADKFRENIVSYSDPDVERMLMLISHNRDSSSDDATNRRLSSLRNSITKIYDVAEPGGKTLDELNNVMARSRDWDELSDAWLAWRDATGPLMRDTYDEFINLQNSIMKENGWSDIGEYWRVSDFEDSDIETLADRLYMEMLPLYEELHAYVRNKLRLKYGQVRIEDDGSIPAHLLGNMWAQQWTNIMDIVKPYPECPDMDVTPTLKEQNYTAKRMFEMAEEFFTSISLDEMTDIFWEKSMIERPGDRDVQCHASASDLYAPDDYRIKMCTYITGGDVYTIHHEMGHIEYDMQYSKQPTLFRRGANAAFHEAIGDTIALSVKTPQHFKAIGLYNDSQTQPDCIESFPSKADINFLMETALTKLAFMPYGYLLDKYRYGIFRGEIDNSNYNQIYWEMRKDIQGLVAPVPRSESDFDPGAKFHVASHVPYMRYFLAHVGQFQFFSAMCEKAGHDGPLHSCDFYRSKPAGEQLKKMLKMGASKPWPDAMEAMTDQREFTTDAIFQYFDPLYKWLQRENEFLHKGWKK